MRAVGEQHRRFAFEIDGMSGVLLHAALREGPGGREAMYHHVVPNWPARRQERVRRSNHNQNSKREATPAVPRGCYTAKGKWHAHAPREQSIMHRKEGLPPTDETMVTLGRRD